MDNTWAVFNDLRWTLTVLAMHRDNDPNLYDIILDTDRMADASNNYGYTEKQTAKELIRIGQQVLADIDAGEEHWEENDLIPTGIIPDALEQSRKPKVHTNTNLGIQIRDLDLDDNVKQVCDKCGIYFVRDLVTKTEKELKQIRDISDADIDEIKSVLRKMDLQLFGER